MGRSPSPVCLIQGVGDVASAVAHLLHSQGYHALLTTVPAPADIRRGMSFVDCAYDGTASLEGILAKRVGDPEILDRMISCRRAIPALVSDPERALALIRPQVLVDARMRKRTHPGIQRGQAALTVGIGPNFTVGREVDLAVESTWGEDLGKVVHSGSTRPLAGEPRPLGRVGRERYVYAHRSGEIKVRLDIGAPVRAGEVAGFLAADPIVSPVSGCVRGIVHAGASVVRGAKLLEIDPRGESQLVFGLGERPKRIAHGVLAAIQQAGLAPGGVPGA